MFQYNRIKQNLQCQQSRTILCINYIKFHFMHFIQFCLVSNDKAILKNGKIDRRKLSPNIHETSVIDMFHMILINEFIIFQFIMLF